MTVSLNKLLIKVIKKSDDRERWGKPKILIRRPEGKRSLGFL
jgi:hypothetical protein